MEIDMRPTSTQFGFRWSYHPNYALPGSELPLEWFRELEGLGKPPWVTYSSQEEAYRALIAAWDRLGEGEQEKWSEHRAEVERIRAELNGESD